jgi:hypothetical protein
MLVLLLLFARRFSKNSSEILKSGMDRVFQTSRSVLPSLLLTAQHQGSHPLGFFETLFGSKT